MLFAEVLHEAGVPPGVFNLVNGDGADGRRGDVARIPDIDMMSFTGSTRAGIAVAQGRRRYGQARGAGAGRQVGQHRARRCRSARRRSRAACMHMIHELRPVLQRADAHVRAARQHDEAIAIAKATAEKVKVGDPFADGTHDRPGRERGAVQQDPGPDPEGHRRRRDAGRRRPRPAGRPEPRLLRAADGVRQRDATT